MTYHFSDILEQRYSRRSLLKAAGMGIAAAALPLPFATRAAASTQVNSLSFSEVARGLDATHHLAEGYQAQVVLRWGDAVFEGAPAFDPHAQTAHKQQQQFGFNNDFIAYFPLNGSSRHGLLCVNHEYTSPETMFAGGRLADALTDAEHRIEMAAHGCSILEMARGAEGWLPIYGAFSRRITASTPMRLAGPAAGHARMQTQSDPKGEMVLGTFANCAGGQTPWNTYLTCEENIDGYFVLEGYEGAERANHERMTLGKELYHRWDKIDKRFSVKDEPHEPNRFGWVVEIDPFDASSTPIKRTALGRFKHEGASPVINHDGRIVVYMGDDEHFQHLYKYVSNDRFDPSRPRALTSLLDEGTLYAARFYPDGRIAWLPLVYGTAPLDASEGFQSQADVLIETRRAAALMGATPMDRPEDVEVNPLTGRIYASLTKNPKRETSDFINQRSPNPMGYVLEMIAPDNDHAALTGQWDLFLQGGNPNENAEHLRGEYGAEVSENGWLACPDNLAFDARGRIWITTDGQPAAIGAADAVYGAQTMGAHRAVTKCLFRAPIGAEVTGPCFVPDASTFFLSVQHPAEGSSFDAPSTRWPDFDPALPPRSAIIAISRIDGGEVGS